MGVRFYINTQEQMDAFNLWASQARLKGKSICVEVIPQGKSSRQRNAMHLWLRQLATALNDSGFDMMHFPFKTGMNIPWTDHSAKDILWRPIEEVMYGHESTEEASGMECAEVYETLVRELSIRLDGFTPPPWPQVPL